MRSLLALTLCLPLFAQPQQSRPAETAIKAMLIQQADAWNRGDLLAFAASYASQCTLVGKEVTETTRAKVLRHYQQKYPTRGAMGKLLFSKIAVHPLDHGFAIVTAQWRLDRDAQSGGPTGGVFSLVCQRIKGEWQIILDHTS